MIKHEDWSETTDRLIQNDELFKQFIKHYIDNDNEMTEKFAAWASKEYPEEYGND